MEQLFLVRGEVTRTGYMVDDSPTDTETRLVYAETADEAELKFMAHWTDQGRNYSHGYRVAYVEVFEAIR